MLVRVSSLNTPYRFKLQVGMPFLFLPCFSPLCSKSIVGTDILLPDLHFGYVSNASELNPENRGGSRAKLKKVMNDCLCYMTLPKGWASGGRGGEGRDDVERMIGRRVENMRGIYILGFALCWAATAGGVYVGVTVYPWAYPLPSGLYALSVLTVIESLGFFFIIKITGEKPVRP
jgi:hypothetical protein